MIKSTFFTLFIFQTFARIFGTLIAGVSSIKMSKNDRIQAQGLQGIDRLYAHFIEAVSNMPIPVSLAAADQKNLRDELIKMTVPFQDKRKDNLAKLRAVSKLSTAESEQINWTEMNVEKTS